MLQTESVRVLLRVLVALIGTLMLAALLVLMPLWLPDPVAAQPADRPADVTPLTDPATYSGAVNYFSQPAGAWQVTVWVTDVLIAGPVTTTVESGVARFTVQVPEDNPATPQRDGARPGDLLTFKVNGMTANETRGWTAGGLFQVNLTVNHMDVCAFAYFDANRNAVRDPDEGAAAGGQLNLYTTFDDRLVESYNILANTPPHCFSQLTPTGYRLVYTPPLGQVLASAGSVTFQAAPPQSFQAPVAPLFTFRSVAPLDIPTRTVTTSPTPTVTPTRVSDIYLDKPVYATYNDVVGVTVFDPVRYTSGPATASNAPIEIYSSASATRIRLYLYRDADVFGQYVPDRNSRVGFCEECRETDVINVQLKVWSGSVITAEYRSLDSALYTATARWQLNPVPTATATPTLGLTPALTRTPTASSSPTATTTATRTTTVTPTSTATQTSDRAKPAVYRTGGLWYLDNTSNLGSAAIVFSYGGEVGEVPLMCDWDGDGTRTPGVVRSNVWFIRNSNSTGGAEMVLVYGLPGDIPVCGDWDGNGTETPAVFRKGNWFLNNSNSSDSASVAFSYGIDSDSPVVGDWDNDGIDTPGVVRGNAWYLRNSNTNGFSDMAYLFGMAGDIPIVGDWNGMDGETAGAVRPGGGFLIWFLRFAHANGPADDYFLYGLPGDIPLVWK